MSNAVRERLRRYREKLLDLSKRNRLLNYRPLRAGTVRIVDELPAEIFRLLVTSGRGFELVAKVEERSPATAADEAAQPPAALDSESQETSEIESESESETADGLEGSSMREVSDEPYDAESQDAIAREGDASDADASDADASDGAADEAADHASSSAEPNEPAEGSGISVEPAGGHLQARARPDAASRERSADAHEAAEDDEDEAEEEDAKDAGDARLFVPYEPEHVDERHRDHRLQTDLSPERLDHNLLRISRGAATSLEEQGFNTLYLSLGALEWTEAGSPRDRYLAPIVLFPVELRRRSPRSPFLLYASDDDPIVNPSLLMKLEREMGVRIDELPDDVLEWDLQALFKEIDEKVARAAGFRIVNDVYLGLFSFTKFTMYKDLEEWDEEYSSNPLIASICGEASPPPPPEIAAPLDEVFEPEATFQVVDADSTQQEAILAIRSGASLVIEGPPGTGKSQTITNVIAECLAAGKRILFVSEKMAALEVVHSRLAQVGLGDFCLELHSRHASKRRVVEELGRTLDLGREAEPEPDTRSLAAIREVRERLNEHVKLLAEPVPPLGVAPWQAISRSAALEDRPEVAVSIPDPSSFTRERLETALKRLEALARARSAVRGAFPDLDHHPWRGSALEELGYSDSVALREEIGRLRDAIAELARRAKAIGERMKVKIPVTANEARKLAERLELLVRTPRPDPQSLTASVWAVGLDEVKRLIERVRDYRENESAIAARWSSAFLDLEHDREAAEVRRHKGLGRFFQPGWWKLRGRLKSALREGASLPPRAQILADLDRAKRAREMRDELSAARERAALLFGSRWRGVESDPDELAAFAEWMKRFATHLEASDARLVELAARGLEDPQGAASEASELRSRIDDLSHAFESFRARAKLDDVGAFGTSLESASFETVLARLGDMRDHIEALHDWGHLVHAERECEEIGLASFLARAREVECADDELAPAFERLFLRLWLDAIFEARPALKRFRRQDHEQAIRDFRELDLAQLRLARRRLRKRLLDSLPDATWEASARSELGILQREIRRKRGHKPIRKLFQEIPNALLRLKPCLLMSPLSVAQFLDPRAIQFDVVIFDEASQISPEDAIGAIARGSQVVIVGDSRQLPPTAFFQRQESADVSLDSDDEDETPDLESILDECVVQGFPRQMLRWHYRSRHESLITFSNHHFYEKRLHTFPSSAEARPDLGVDFVHVADGIFDRAGTRANEVEADRVAQAVLEHFRRNPDRSLGVGAFSQAQQTAILDRLEALRREDESLEELFSPDREEPFFVKNLENIQGDERDVIFLSVGYGRDSHGKLYLNFGPLNKPGGERRLNVLVTRARRKLTVFSSIRSSDIDESRVSGIGPKLLKRYLEYAELGGRSAAAESATREALDGSLDRDYQGLEEAIAERLRASGHDVVAGVGHSRHRLGLAVRDAGKGSYILGIDTDGPAWQEQGTARDRERLRQQVLEGLGWRVHQVWSTEWLRNARGELDRILAAIERAKEGALEPEVLPLLDAAQKKASSRKKAPRRARPAEDLVRPYTVAMLDPAGEPDEFGESARAIAARLVATVRAEAPIHKSEATRRVAACWKIPKITRSVEETITAAIDKAAAEERIRIDAEDFLWLPGEADDLVPRSREAENAPRDADLIALEELATAAAIVLDRELRVPREDLVARTGRILGFSRTSGRLRERILTAIAHLVASGRAAEKEGGLEPVRES